MGYPASLRFVLEGITVWILGVLLWVLLAAFILLLLYEFTVDGRRNRDVG